MKLELVITFADGSTETVKVRPVTQVAFERQYKRSMSEVDGVEHLCWLGWHALGRKGSFDSWLDSVDSVEPADDEDPVPLES